MNHEVLGRLAEVERHLQLIRASVPYSVLQRNQRCPPTRTSVDEQPKSASVELLSALETDGQTFAGELSMAPALGEEDETSDCTNNASSGMLPEYPSPGSSLHHPTTRRVSGWLESILTQHGVVADEQQWRYDLQCFMDEVHPFYACLHSPKVWETFNDMWEYSTPWSLTDAAGRERKRLSLALVFFCLALGRCSVSLTTADASAVYSSGWSLYSVGMTLLQGGMETSSAATKSLPMLQALVIRVSCAGVVTWHEVLIREDMLTLSRPCTYSVWMRINKLHESWRLLYPWRMLLGYTVRAPWTACRLSTTSCSVARGGLSTCWIVG